MKFVILKKNGHKDKKFEELRVRGENDKITYSNFKDNIIYQSENKEEFLTKLEALPNGEYLAYAVEGELSSYEGLNYNPITIKEEYKKPHLAYIILKSKESKDKQFATINQNIKNNKLTNNDIKNHIHFISSNKQAFEKELKQLPPGDYIAIEAEGNPINFKISSSLPLADIKVHAIPQPAPISFATWENEGKISHILAEIEQIITVDLQKLTEDSAQYKQFENYLQNPDEHTNLSEATKQNFTKYKQALLRLGLLCNELTQIIYQNIAKKLPNGSKITPDELLPYTILYLSQLKSLSGQGLYKKLVENENNLIDLILRIDGAVD